MVHISSRTGIKSDGYDSAYAASKAGLIRLVESMSQELKGYDINVNCILPSTIDTEANRRAMPKADFSKWLLTEDLANVVLFLCSSDSKVIMPQFLLMDCRKKLWRVFVAGCLPLEYVHFKMQIQHDYSKNIAATIGFQTLIKFHTIKVLFLIVILIQSL